jgi:hypothetical protein
VSNINGLTDKQKAWLNSYLVCWNGAQAARDAGYECVYQSAHDNLINPKISQAISNRLRGQAMSADEVLNRLGEQARSDIGAFLGKGGILDLDAAKEKGITHLIKSISWSKQGVRIELYSAQEALDKIGKAHGLFKDVHEQQGKLVVEVIGGYRNSTDQPKDAT